MANQVVTTAVFRAEEQGVDAVAAKLAKLQAEAIKASGAVPAFSRATQAAMAQVAKDNEAAAKAVAAARATMTDKGASQQVSVSFERNAAALRKIAEEARKVTGALDPAARATAELARRQEQLNALVEAGAISQDDYGRYTAIVNERMAKFGNVANDAGEKVRLTGSQVQNLGYQLNDAATMLLSGSSPFQVMATQGGQVIQALGDGPGGVRGSLRAMFDTAKDGAIAAAGALGPIGIGLVGITAAAGAFALVMRKNIPDANETLRQHSEILSRVAAQYEGVGEILEEIGRKGGIGVKIELDAKGGELEEQLKRQFAELDRAFAGADSFFGNAKFGGINIKDLPSLEKFSPAKAMVDAFRTSLRDGTADVQKFNADLDAAYKTAGNDTELKKGIQAIQGLIQPLLSTATALDQNKAAATGAAEAMVRFRNAMDDLKALTPDVRTQAQQINDAFAAAMKNAGDVSEAVVARIQQQKALAADAMGAVDMLDAARAEGASIGLGEEAKAVAAVEQEYAKLRAQYEGNAEALIALDKWRDQSINNAGRQAAFDRDQEAAKEAEAAAKRATDEAQRYAEATRSRIAGIDQSVAAQRMEIEALGETEGGAAALRFEFQALSAARQAAAAAGTVVSDEEIAAIRQAAGEIGALTDQYQAMQEAQEQAKRLAETFDDIAFERSIMGLSDAEQRVREAIRATGVEYASLDGQRLAGELRYNDALRQTQDELRRTGEFAEDAFGGLIDALTQGGDLMENLIGFAADLGRQFAAMGAKKLFGDLFGTGSGSGSAANDNKQGIVGAIVSAVSGNLPIPTPRPANSNIPVPTPRPSYQSPSYAYADKYAVPALTKATASLDAAAKAIRTIESGSAAGNYSALGPVTKSGDRAYGAYQVMGANIPQWSREAIGRVVSNVEFLGSPDIQDAVFKSRFGDRYAAKYGMVGASQAWFAGEGGMRNLGRTDIVGTSVGTYASKFSNLYDRHLNTASSTNDARLFERATATGTEKGFTRAVESYEAGRFDSGSAQGGLFGTRGQAGLSVLGAGIGAFGSGYQSGSPFSGGLSGALGGYQAGGAISSALNIGPMAGSVLGVVGGAALGILGGILGARAKRKAAHQEAAARWAEMRPQYEAFDKSLSGDGNGQLRQWITEQEGQFSQFRQVGGAAWKYGSGNSTAQFNSTGTKMWTRFMEMMDEYREGIPDMIEDLVSGEGANGAFAKGRAAAKDLKKQIKDMIDDVSIAFGSSDIGVGVSADWEAASKEWEERRNAAIAQANSAAGEYALSLLYTAATTSDVQKSLDGFRGTAAGLQKILTDLGWTAEKAAADIDERLTQAIAKMGETFTDGFKRQINDLQGAGYLNDVTDLIKARDEALSDAKLLGVDPSVVTKWFDLAAQDIVDGSELVGSAFDDLVKAFPELAGVVHAFTGGARTAAEAARAAQAAALSSYEAAKSQLESVYQTVLSYRDGIRSFLDGIKIGDESTLSQADQVAEARRVYEETLAKANGGDRDAMGNLAGAAQDYLSEAKDYFASSADYTAIFDSVNASLKSADVKATSQLDLMRSEASWLEDISGSNIEIAKVLSDYVESQKKLNVNRSWGVMADQNKAIWNDLQSRGIDYTGNFGGGQFLDWVASQAPSMQAIIRPIIDKWSAVYAPKGFATGGWTGAMATNAVAGVVHGQEFVAHAEATRRWRPQLEAMNAGATRLPMVSPVQMPAVDAREGDNRAVIAELRESNRLLRQQIATMGQGLAQNVQATERGNRATEDMAMAARRDQIRGRAA